MITEFRIENYKSIENLTINLGRVNVFFGENGCGKSNILEALTLASAAWENKLDNEYLTARGIRVTSPSLMRSAFDIDKLTSSIKLGLRVNNDENIEYELFNDNKPYSQWGCKMKIKSEELQTEYYRLLDKIFLSSDKTNIIGKNELELSLENEKKVLLLIDSIFCSTFLNKDFKDFLIYSPENTALRTFEKEGQIEPLGTTGEGLFKLLKYFSSREQKENFNKIKENLRLFDWFKDFNVPEKLFEGESFLQIKDRYLDKNIEYFDQKSSNEGFLFVLFYLSLIISDKTPNFFAIDNIEASLNPKLCTKLIKTISELCTQNEKQIIVTTHSPAVLDGLDLNDKDQKLFLVYRNKTGRTIVAPVEKPKPIEGQDPVKLSEAFLRGYIGGLPKNFSI